MASLRQYAVADKMAEIRQANNTSNQAKQSRSCIHTIGYAIPLTPPNQRYGVIYRHDNAPPHVNHFTKNAIQDLSWEVVLHLAYPTNLAPSDYQRFRSISSSLRCVSFNNDVTRLILRDKTW